MNYGKIKGVRVSDSKEALVLTDNTKIKSNTVSNTHSGASLNENLATEER